MADSGDSRAAPEHGVQDLMKPPISRASSHLPLAPHARGRVGAEPAPGGAATRPNACIGK